MRARILMAVLICACPIYSQDFSVGVGQNLGASAFTPGLIPWKMKFASATGFFLTGEFNNTYLLQSGLYYNFSGAKQEMLLLPDRTGIDEILRQDYLRVPLIFKIRLGDTGRFLAGAGGYFNYFLNYSTRTAPAKYSSYASQEDLELKKHVFGLLIRPEFEFPLYGNIFSIGLQLEIGLTSFAERTRPLGTYLFLGYKWDGSGRTRANATNN